ncbi:hypothetical protein RJ639_021546 [Escallonia herrerae]|uniref:BED-type domain-containing protein n=1 Tax=Escallonia herrerae TaxID=1293975 RepID=A0AA88V4P2_9ASTE|nr:hypothetical protein RJ639_021546 [Escallonia herrerae]
MSLFSELDLLRRTTTAAPQGARLSELDLRCPDKIMSSNKITSSPVASSPVQTPRATLEDQTSEPSTPNASMGVSASEPVDLDSGPDDLNNENLKSSVWAHFERKKNAGNVTATCSHCRKTLGANPKNGTTHLRMHLDRCKRLRQPDVRQKLLAGIMGKANAKPELGNYSFDQDFARRELGTMIILHEYPLSIVDHVGFRRYSSALQPLFKIPTRDSVKSDIINIYEHEREQMMKLLEGIRSRVAVTTDLWTSGNQKKGFMAVTGHFIDEEFILQSRILRFTITPTVTTAAKRSLTAAPATAAAVAGGASDRVGVVADDAPLDARGRRSDGVAKNQRYSGERDIGDPAQVITIDLSASQQASLIRSVQPEEIKQAYNRARARNQGNNREMADEETQRRNNLEFNAEGQDGQNPQTNGWKSPIDKNVQEVVNEGNVRGAQQVEQLQEMLNTVKVLGDEGLTLDRFVKLVKNPFFGKPDPTIAEEWLVRVEKILDTARIRNSQRLLQGIVVFSKLELRSGYHQVRIRKEDIPKITFQYKHKYKKIKLEDLIVRLRIEEDHRQFEKKAGNYHQEAKTNVVEQGVLISQKTFIKRPTLTAANAFQISMVNCEVVGVVGDFGFTPSNGELQTGGGKRNSSVAGPRKEMKGVPWLLPACDDQTASSASVA